MMTSLKRGSITIEHSSIICLGRLLVAYRYIYNLWQLRQRVDSLAQWLEHWIFNREDGVRFPRQAWKFFQLCFIPLFRLSCRKTQKTLFYQKNKHGLSEKNQGFFSLINIVYQIAKPDYSSDKPKLPILRVAGCGLRVADCGLRAAGHI